MEISMISDQVELAMFIENLDDLKEILNSKCPNVKKFLDDAFCCTSFTEGIIASEWNDDTVDETYF